MVKMAPSDPLNPARGVCMAVLLSTIFYLVTGLIVLLAFITWAEAAEPRVCFSQKTASNMVASLERGKLAEEELVPAYRNALDEYKNTVKEYEELVKSLSEGKAINEKMVQDLNDRLVQFGKECNQAIEAAKPTFWTYFGSGTVGAILGAAIALLIVL